MMTESECFAFGFVVAVAVIAMLVWFAIACARRDR